MTLRTVALSAVLVLSGLCVSSAAQSLGPDFASDYTLSSLGAPSGVPFGYGGMTFKDGDPSKLLLIGATEQASSAIYEIDVTRDADGHIDGFSGVASVFSTSPDASGGLGYGPGGVLFYTTWPSNTVGQISPSSTSPDKIVNLGPLGVATSVAGLAITPGTFPGGGSLKLSTYGGSTWYSADLVFDLTGTYDITNVTNEFDLPNNGPVSIVYLDVQPAFPTQSAVIVEFNNSTVGAWEIDANGDPIAGTRRTLISGLAWGSGTQDPTNGDLLFATYAGGEVTLVRNMPAPPPGFCFGDGSGTPCPCGNDSASGSGGGCTNGSGTACVLSSNDQTSVGTDSLSFNVTGANAFSFGVLVSGDNQLGGGLGIIGATPFDGLRCVGGGLLRHGSRATDGSGANANPWGTAGNPLISGNGWIEGQTRHFQLRYREDPMVGPCGTGQNTSQAISVTFTPPPPDMQWEVLENSPLAPFYHHDDIDFVGDIGWLCNISGEIWKTPDAGLTWTRVWNQPSAAFRTITFADEMNGWVGNLGPGSWVSGLSDTDPLYSTTDGGLTWTPVPLANITGTPPDGICGMQAVDANTIYGAGRYAGNAYFIASTDGGATWISRDLNTAYTALVDCLFFSPMEGYITGNDVNGNAALIYTTDGGVNWTTVMNNNSYHYWKVGFASADFGYGVAWAGTDSNKWIQTYDGGQTWTDSIFANGYEANGIGFFDQQVGWIGGPEANTYQTLDGGATWHTITLDPVYDDAVNQFVRVGDVIYAVGNRIYRYADTPLGGGSFSGASTFDNSLSSLSTSKNADGSYTITYTVPEDDNVQITIHDRGGLIVDRPIDELKRAGTYSFDFTPAPGVANGLPLYASLVSGMYRQAKKLDK